MIVLYVIAAPIAIIFVLFILYLAVGFVAAGSAWIISSIVERPERKAAIECALISARSVLSGGAKTSVAGNLARAAAIDHSLDAEPSRARANNSNFDPIPILERALSRRSFGKNKITRPIFREDSRPVLPAVQATPPDLAEYLLELLAPAEWSEAAAGDFFERFQRKFRRVNERHGLRKARLDYWWQVLRSAPGLLHIRFRDLAVFGGLAKVITIFQHWITK